MIIAQDAISVLPPHQFLAYMLVPALTTWVFTTLWIEHSWIKSRNTALFQVLQCNSQHQLLLVPNNNSKSTDNTIPSLSTQSLMPHRPLSLTSSSHFKSSKSLTRTHARNSSNNNISGPPPPIIAEQQLLPSPSVKLTKIAMLKKVITTPFPYAML